MPELPEVETIARSLARALPGLRIERVVFKRSSLLREGSDRPCVLEGARIVDVGRVGKNVVVRSNPSRKLVVNLGMTGKLLCGPRDGFPPDCSGRHVHLRLLFSGGTELRYHDTRRFGFILVTGDVDVAGLLGLGKDPFHMKPRDLARILEGRKAAIKAILLDQSSLSGIGNIYADETLFRAGIHPSTPAGAAASRAASVLDAARRVLREAIKHRGTTLSDYRDADGSKGSFQERLSVYGREGKPCRACGSVIRKIRVAGRGTHYCPSCQRPAR